MVLSFSSLLAHLPSLSKGLARVGGGDWGLRAFLSHCQAFVPNQFVLCILERCYTLELNSLSPSSFLVMHLSRDPGLCLFLIEDLQNQGVLVRRKGILWSLSGTGKGYYSLMFVVSKPSK